MNVAKLTIPVEKSDAVLPVGGETGSVVPKMVMSSGSGLNWQLGVVYVTLVGKELVGHAHLDEVSFA